MNRSIYKISQSFIERGIFAVKEFFTTPKQAQQKYQSTRRPGQCRYDYGIIFHFPQQGRMEK